MSAQGDRRGGGEIVKAGVGHRNVRFSGARAQNMVFDYEVTHTRNY